MIADGTVDYVLKQQAYILFYEEGYESWAFVSDAAERNSVCD